MAAYSATAERVAEIFAVLPGLRWLGLLELYSAYLLYLGLPVLMKAPQQKAVAYTSVVIGVGFVRMLIVTTIVGRFMAMPMA